MAHGAPGEPGADGTPPDKGTATILHGYSKEQLRSAITWAEGKERRRLESNRDALRTQNAALLEALKEMLEGSTENYVKAHGGHWVFWITPNALQRARAAIAAAEGTEKVTRGQS